MDRRVGDRTARSWINRNSSPSSHLIGLAMHSSPVMATVLRLTGHDHAALLLDLIGIETALETALTTALRLPTEGRQLVRSTRGGTILIRNILARSPEIPAFHEQGFSGKLVDLSPSRRVQLPAKGILSRKYLPIRCTQRIRGERERFAADCVQRHFLIAAGRTCSLRLLMHQRKYARSSVPARACAA